MSVIAGVVLAGGLSSRMGEDKSFLTLPQSQQTLLDVAKNQLSSFFGSRVFVSGSQHKNGIPDIRVNCGPLAGVYSALKHFSQHYPNINYVLFTAVDMPDADVETYQRLLAYGQKNQCICCFEDCYLPLFVPINKALMVYLSKQLNCGIDADKAVRHEIKEAPKNRNYSIKNMLKALNGAQIPVHEAQLDNINTPQQWQRHCAHRANAKVKNSE